MHMMTNTSGCCGLSAGIATKTLGRILWSRNCHGYKNDDIRLAAHNCRSRRQTHLDAKVSICGDLCQETGWRAGKNKFSRMQIVD